MVIGNALLRSSSVTRGYFMDSNILTMIGVLGGTLIVAMVLLYLSLKTAAPSGTKRRDK
jgi:hypothetical protein